MLISGGVMLNFCVAGALLGDPYRKASTERIVDAVEEDPLLQDRGENESLIGINQHTERPIPDKSERNGDIKASVTTNGQPPGTHSSSIHNNFIKDRLYRVLQSVKETCATVKEISTVQLVLYLISMFQTSLSTLETSISLKVLKSL